MNDYDIQNRHGIQIGSRKGVAAEMVELRGFADRLAARDAAHLVRSAYYDSNRRAPPCRRSVSSNGAVS